MTSVLRDMFSFKQTRLIETPFENVWGDCRLTSMHYEPQKILLPDANLSFCIVVCYVSLVYTIRWSSNKNLR